MRVNNSYTWFHKWRSSRNASLVLLLSTRNSRTFFLLNAASKHLQKHLLHTDYFTTSHHPRKRTEITTSLQSPTQTPKMPRGKKEREVLIWRNECLSWSERWEGGGGREEEMKRGEGEGIEMREWRKRKEERSEGVHEEGDRRREVQTTHFHGREFFVKTFYPWT